MSSCHRLLDALSNSEITKKISKESTSDALNVVPDAINSNVVGPPDGFRASLHGVRWRYQVETGDVERIRRLVTVTGFFNDQEVDVAAELVHERLAKRQASGYMFILAEHFGHLVGYTCYGPIACTDHGFDLYWIAVSPDFQRRGLGRQLLKETEERIANAGGMRIYVDTSQRPQYASTRAFYENCGYQLEALLPDFYGPGDGKAIYCKRLPGRLPAHNSIPS